MKLVFVASPRSNKQKKRAKNEEQTIQWPKDRQYNGQKTDNTMAKRQTIQWPKDRQYNGQKTDNTMAKRKMTNNDLQKQHRKVKIK